MKLRAKSSISRSRKSKQPSVLTSQTGRFTLHSQRFSPVHLSKMRFGDCALRVPLIVTYKEHQSQDCKQYCFSHQPSKQVEVISSSENKQITAWGDTRNKAGHGKFADLTYAEVSMVLGVRAFIDRHLP
jgi:hypothetical protein